MTQSYLVAIGGNLPTRGKTVGGSLQSAVVAIAAKLGRITAQSPLFRNPAFPPGSGPDFLNGALKVESDLSPEEFLSGLHEVEASLGRERHERWAARPIDLDLIAAGDLVTPDTATWRHWYQMSLDEQREAVPDRLILPHPRLQDRAFVLVPLMEVDPLWRHPVLNRTIAEFCAELSAEDRQSVVLQEDPGCQ